MERNEILILCHSNPEFIASYIEDLEFRCKDLEFRCKDLESKNIELLEQINELESLLKQNSQTSKKPTSTGVLGYKRSESKNSQEISKKRPGGQKGHCGSTLMMSKSPDEIVINRLCNCKYCGRSIEETEAIGYEKRQKFDIIIKHKITEYRSEIKKCPYCNRKNKADFPESITKSVQFGNMVLTLVTYLRNFHLIPYDRIKMIVKDIFGLGISSATIKKAENIFFQNLKGFTNHIKNKLIKEHVITCDETGINVNGQRHHCHLISTDKLTFYFHHRSRGSIAMEKMGVLPRFKGVMVHDFWKSYFKFEKCKHAMCNVHILRELNEIYKDNAQEWAIEMSQLLYEMKKYVDDARKLNNKIEEETIEAFKQKYDSILMKGFEVNPPPKNLEVYTDKRGVQAQSKAKNLLDRLAKYKNEVLRFATDLRVPFGNNQAERDLRMITVQQNISGSFRTPHGADAFCRIRGFISTMTKNNMPVISSLYAVFEGDVPLP
jgi:transposase